MNLLPMVWLHFTILQVAPVDLATHLHQSHGATPHALQELTLLLADTWYDGFVKVCSGTAAPPEFQHIEQTCLAYYLL